MRILFGRDGLLRTYCVESGGEACGERKRFTRKRCADFEVRDLAVLFVIRHLGGWSLRGDGANFTGLVRFGESKPFLRLV